MSVERTVFFWTLLVIGVLVQESYGTKQKCEYVLCIPEPYRAHIADTPHVLISTSSLVPVIATVMIYGTDFQVNSTVTRGTFVDITLPDSAYIRDSGVRSDKTVIVTADEEISVHVTLNNGASGDGYLVLPTHQLGTNHHVLAYEPYNPESQFSFICVSSLNQYTEIDIKTNGQTVNIQMQPYQSYQLVISQGTDITGSQVTSDYPITVIAGTQCGYIRGGCDAFVEQMPPVRIWGTHVVLSPFISQENGYLYRVTGTNVTTDIIISNVGNQTLSKRQWYQGDVNSNDIITIDADYPILVMQYIKGISEVADASMILAPSDNMYIFGLITFPVFRAVAYDDYDIKEYSYFIHVIIGCTQINGLKYDDSSMSNWETLTSSDGAICSVRGNITENATHTVNHDNSNTRFSVAVYAVAPYTSYTYLAGIQYKVDEMPTMQPTTELTTNLFTTHDSKATQQAFLRVTCPPTQEVSRPISLPSPFPVTLSNPTITGGTTPYNIIINPQSGSDFNDGQTTVTVSVSDSASGSGFCTFIVNVTSNPNPKTGNEVSDSVIISAIVGGVVVVVVISLLCFCLMRNTSSNGNASPDYATSIPLSNTSVPETSDKTPGTRELNTEDDCAGYEKPLDNSGYMDIDSSAVKQSTYQGLYADIN